MLAGDNTCVIDLSAAHRMGDKASSSSYESRLPAIALSKTDDFTAEEAATLLNSESSEVLEKTISLPPCLPKAGEAYLFCPDDNRNTSKFNLYIKVLAILHGVSDKITA